MINKEQTRTTFGYSPEELSDSSSKKLSLTCDYCRGQYTATMKNRNNSYKKLPKDCCKGCRFKKREEISLKKYGCKNSSQRPEIRDKIKDSNKDWINSEKFKEQRKETMIKRYGVEYQMQSESYREKRKVKLIEKYGVDNPMLIEGVAKTAGEKSLATKIKNGQIRTIEGKTIPQTAKDLGFSRSHFGKLVNKLGVEEALKHENKTSSLEQFVIHTLEAHNIEFTQHFRVENKICDIKVDKTLIECDGLYWHSDILPER